MSGSNVITLPRHKIYDEFTGIFLPVTLVSQVFYLPLMFFMIVDKTRARGNI